jgi:hypothetical protein
MAAATGRVEGDPIPPGCGLIEVRVADLNRLFNAMDPSPFREKDLDPNAESFIVDWARELPGDGSLALLVYVDGVTGAPDEVGILREGVHEFFADRAREARGRLRRLLRVGRVSLAIGLAFLAVSIVAGDALARTERVGHFGGLLQESLLIGGWVAMWRPLEIFLYDWWPVRAEARLYDRLAAMFVRIAYPA